MSINPPPQSTLIFHEASRHRDFRQRLITDIPDLDEVTLADTLEGLTDLNEMLAAVVRSALDDEAIVAGLSTRLADMKARLERIEHRAKRKREIVREAMLAADLAKLSEPDFTASLKQSAPTLDLVAEDQIPPAYWKPQPSKLDKQGILEALKAGTSIAGARLAATGIQLSVRSK